MGSSLLGIYESNEILVVGDRALNVLESPRVSTNETLDKLRPFNSTRPSLRNITGVSVTGGSHYLFATGSSLSTASKAVISYIQIVKSKELILDVGAANSTCTMTSGPSSLLKARYMSGSWVNPTTDDLYVVDSGCGLLYRYDNKTFTDPDIDPVCDPFGSCGIRTTVANLTANASFQADIGQFTSMVGDVSEGILYIAYGEQCGIMSYSLASELKIGFVTSIDLPIAGNITMPAPVCGYAGKSAT